MNTRVACCATSPLLVALLLFSGCHKNRTHITTTPAVFAMDTELDSESDEDYLYWSTDLSDARVDFRVRHFEDGGVRLRVYDADGFEIFDRSYWWDDFGDFSGDELHQISYTDFGTPGEWLLRLNYSDVSGHMYLTLD